MQMKMNRKTLDLSAHTTGSESGIQRSGRVIPLECAQVTRWDRVVFWGSKLLPSLGPDRGVDSEKGGSHNRVRKMGMLGIVGIVATMGLDSCAKPVGLAYETVSVEAPFEMPVITIPDFTQCPRFEITALGAVQGDKEKTSAAIELAMAHAHAAKGGVVVIPKGNWLTGPVHFKSNVCLQLDEGAVLEFSENPEDYLPAVQTTWEGMECYNYSPLIYAFECENVAITGKGKLKARLEVWRVWYARPPAHMEALKRLYDMASTDVPVEARQMVGQEANLRPQFIQFNRCNGVLLDGISIEDSPFWVIHPFLCQDVVIRNVRVSAHGHNNDGVDPEMTQNMLIEDCSFDQGDDAIAVKSGRNQDAWRLDTPTKNLVIRNCYVKNGHQLLAIGSELSGGVENVLIENCALEPSTDSVMHLLFIKTNERRGGWVKNIHMRNITAGDMKFGVLGIETDVLYQWRDLVKTYEVRLTPIEGVYLEHVQAGNMQFVTRIQGNQDLPIRHVSLKQVTVKSVSEAQFLNSNVEEFVLEE